MSDYGCVLLFKKAGGLSTSEKEEIINILEEIIPDSNYSIMIQTGDFTEFLEWDEGVECIRLTEYYLGEEDDDELQEFAKSEDLPDAQEIANILQQRLSSGIEITAEFSDW